ncbi:hypothetical protein ES705_13359 [subsurface metagenome]
MPNNLGLPIGIPEGWLPMPYDMGPPLPRYLGIYWPWYAPPGAEFRISDPVISPAEVQVGSPVTISCLVTNIGTEAGSYTVKLGGDFVAEQEITLEPGESKVVSFDVTPAEAKTYSVSVDGLVGTFRAVEVPVADIRVEDLTIEPAEVYVGEKVTISVLAKNYGTKAGSRTIICNVT